MVNTLAMELSNLFVDDELNDNMMDGECSSDPEWGSVGYADALDHMGVTYKNIDQYGGEDRGSDFYTVWEFTRDDETVWFKFQGWYQSYEGATFERVFEVKPKEKVVTVWE